MRDFHGRTAFITGGAGGFGRAFAKALLAEGANIALADIDERALTRAVEELEAPPDRVLGLVADVSERTRSNGRRGRRSKPSDACISSSTTPGSAAAAPDWKN